MIIEGWLGKWYTRDRGAAYISPKESRSVVYESEAKCRAALKSHNHSWLNPEPVKVRIVEIEK